MPSPSRNLLSLNPELVHTILVNLCNEDISDLCAARMASKTLSEVGKTPEFYKEVDVVFMTTPPWNHSLLGLIFFRRKCYQHDNLSAIFRRGLSEYFRNHMLEGLDKIKRAADGGYLFARYVYDMFMLITTADDEGNLHHAPTISRGDCWKMRLKLIGLNQHEGVRSPQLYMDRLLRISRQYAWCNDCKRYDQWLYWWNDTATNPFICHDDFWRLEIRRFQKYIYRNVEFLYEFYD